MLCKKCKKELQEGWLYCPWCGLNAKKPPKQTMYRRKDGLYEKKVTIDGKRVAFRAKSEKEVIQKIAAYSADAKSETTALFKKYAEDLERSWDELAYNTLRSYKPALKRCVDYFGDMPVGDITPYSISLFLSKMATTYSQKTIKNHLSMISQTLDLAVMNNEIATNPASIKYKPTGKKPVKRKEAAEQYAEVIRQYWEESLYSWLAYFLLNTGLRKGEALALQYKDIDMEENLISVSKSVYFISDNPYIKEPKTSAGIRLVILPLCVKEKLKPGKPNDYIFSTGGKPLHEHQIDAGWDRFCKAHDMGEWIKGAGGKNRFKPAVTFHQLRHYYATKGSELGIPREVMTELMGHSSYIVTENYTHIRKAALQSAAEKINGTEMAQ